MIEQNHTRCVLITGARAPVALHMARLFNDAGWRVILADTLRNPISKTSRACAGYTQLPSPRFNLTAYQNNFGTLLEHEKPELVIPTCEEVFYLAAIWPILCEGMSFKPMLFAPDLEQLKCVHNKFEFIQLCQKIGLQTPVTKMLESSTDLDRVKDRVHRLVFKPVWSRFASKVFIKPSVKMLRKIMPSPQMPWVAQEYIDGTEISVYAVAKNGHLVSSAAYQSKFKAGQGAGICFERIDCPKVQSFVDHFVKETNWSGQISFDLMRLGDGQIMPLECNPRATSGLHFYRNAKAFVDAVVLEEGRFEPDVHTPQTLPFAMWIFGFPKALLSGSIGSFFQYLHRSDNFLKWHDDPKPIRRQWQQLLEFTFVAIVNRTSLQRAATDDIEWNGPHQS